MAKKGGKSKGAVSNGERRSVKASTSNAIRKAYKQSGDRVMNQLKALQKGKDVVMTIENPNKEDLGRKFIKVRVSGKEYVAKMKDQKKAAKKADKE